MPPSDDTGKAAPPELHFFFIAGEESGDRHGAFLLRAMRELYPRVRAVGLGGNHLAEAGMTLRVDMKKNLSIIGLAGVVKNFRQIMQVFRETEAYLKKHRPDALILIDYPGFNIRIADRAKNLGIPVFWYISPQIWAWKKKRLNTLARVVDLMVVIFPFELPLYKRKNVNVAYVGHPLFDEIELGKTKEEVYHELGIDAAKPLITLVPGSRKREVMDFLHIMLMGARRYRERHPTTQFAIIQADTIDRTLLQKIIHREKLDFKIHIVNRMRFDLRRHADFSWVKSGTSTLEAAILGAPHLIVYKVNWLTWVIGKQLLTNAFIGLPNIVAGTLIVPELLQDEFTPLNLVEQTSTYMDNPQEYRTMVTELNRVRDKLGGPGASERTARAMLEQAGVELPKAAIA